DDIVIGEAALDAAEDVFLGREIRVTDHTAGIFFLAWMSHRPEVFQQDFACAADTVEQVLLEQIQRSGAAASLRSSHQPTGSVLGFHAQAWNVLNSRAERNAAHRVQYQHVPFPGNLPLRRVLNRTPLPQKFTNLLVKVLYRGTRRPCCHLLPEAPFIWPTNFCRTSKFLVPIQPRSRLKASHQKIARNPKTLSRALDFCSLRAVQLRQAGQDLFFS